MAIPEIYQSQESTVVTKQARGREFATARELVEEAVLTWAKAVALVEKEAEGSYSPKVVSLRMKSLPLLLPLRHWQ